MNEQQFYQQFEQIANQTVEKWNVPAIAIGVIKDGKVIYTNGFGQAKHNGDSKPDQNSLYQIGSCSKAFTAAICCKLADEGLLDLDTPIRKYAPEIRFMDSFVNNNITLRDLLSHRWGMGRHEFSWYRSGFTREQLCLNIRYLEPNRELREVFQYSNHGFILAGYIAERVSGKTWEQLVEQYIFNPLEMTRSTTYLEDVDKDDNVAEPFGYDKKDDKNTLKPIDFYRTGLEDKSKNIGAPFGPAGSITSTINDMLKWVNLHLNNGKVNGQQIISEKMMKEMHKPQMLMPDANTPLSEFCEFNTYALGWRVMNYRGRKFIEHTGGIDGYTSYTTFMPELNMGIVSYCNIYAQSPHLALTKIIYDYYLGIEDLGKADRWFEWMNAATQDEFNFVKYVCGNQIPNTTLSHELSNYAGIYHKDGYPEMEIEHRDEQLYIHFFGNEAPLVHYHYDTFTFEKLCDDLADQMPILFTLSPKEGKVDGLQVPFLMEPNSDLVKFKKTK